MKNDLDSLLQQNDLDALLVVGPGDHNPAMTYFTGGAHITDALLVKKRGEQPLLFSHSMERDEAARSGLQTKIIEEYRFQDLLKEHGGDVQQATIDLYCKMLADAGLASGRVALYGITNLGRAYGLFSGLQKALPEITFVGELGAPTLLQAMATKDGAEVERIRRMGRITTEVVGLTADYLTSHEVREETLIKPDGAPLTVGDVKARINLWLAERGAENPEGTIFAIGRDAGVPHSAGNPSDVIQLGKTIVFDIFPTELGGGYFYDFTRTWCLGYAPAEAVEIYEDVLAVFQQIMAELKAGEPTRAYQERTCELFEARGHPTVRSQPQTQEGYVHSLGHGLGLHVHERPMFGITATAEDVLAPGVVVTIEPGLYYPERGLGVRLEDTIYVHRDGTIETLAEYPLDLVLPMQS